MEIGYLERLGRTSVFESLVKHINFDCLEQSVIEMEVLTTTTADFIKGKEGLDERNRCLLQCLQEGKPEACDLFVYVLHMKKMDMAVRLLRCDADDLPRLLMSSKRPASPSGAQLEEQTLGSGCASNAADCDRSEAQATVDTASSALLEVVKAANKKEGKRIYRMVRSPRGKCIIINNRDFEDIYTTRYGSDVDVLRMKWLFSALLFECDVHRNLTAKEMMEVLKAAAESEKQNDADCLVVILMSHGDLDIIFGSDCEPLNFVNDIYPLFNNENCPALQGKPKLFFVQACRGDKDDSGTYVKHVSRDVGHSSPSAPSEVSCAPTGARTKRIATYKDMYVVYATIPGYLARRNTVTGSWLLSAVYSVFSKHAHHMHLEDMMHLVQDEVLDQAAKDGAKMTPCVMLSGWVKQLYFNPGWPAETVATPTHTS